MSHRHLDEEELMLHYYGEAPEAEQRLAECPECRAQYGAIQRTLNTADALPVPERGPDYGAEVWRRLEPRLSARRLRWLIPQPWRWAAAGVAVAALLVVAFLAGRSTGPAAKPAPMAAAGPQSERVLLVALADCLDRSQMVLVELANADPKGDVDISAQQARAEDLVADARLYRQTAAHTGDSAAAGILDELERVMVDITHEPSHISPAGLETLRERLKAEGILFKIRVLGSNVRREETPAENPARQTL